MEEMGLWEIINGGASVLGVLSFFLGLIIKNDVKKYRLELLEYIDNDFDLKKIDDLLEYMLLFTSCLTEDGNFEQQAYTYILANCNNFSKFDSRIKKSVKKLINYDDKINKRVSKEKNNDLKYYYIKEYYIVGKIFEELTWNLERINKNENREIVRRIM